MLYEAKTFIINKNTNSAFYDRCGKQLNSTQKHYSKENNNFS